MSSDTGTEPKWITWIDRVTYIGVTIAGVATAIMSLQIVADIFSRTFLNQPLPGTIEMASYWWMPAIAFFAIGFAQITDRQIRVMLLIEGGKPAHIRILDMIMEIVCVAFVLIMLYLSILRVISSYETEEAGFINPWLVLWPGRLVVVIGLVITVFASVARIYRLLRVRGLKFDELGNPVSIVGGEQNPEMDKKA